MELEIDMACHRAVRFTMVDGEVGHGTCLDLFQHSRLPAVQVLSC